MIWEHIILPSLQVLLHVKYLENISRDKGNYLISFKEAQVLSYYRENGFGNLPVGSILRCKHF